VNIRILHEIERWKSYFERNAPVPRLRAPRMPTERWMQTEMFPDFAYARRPFMFYHTNLSELWKGGR
jgi:hypothetical protein